MKSEFRIVPTDLLQRLLGDACNENWLDLNRLLHAPQPPALDGSVSILSGPGDSVCWTQDSKPKNDRKQVVLIDYFDFLRLQEQSFQGSELIYQARWNGICGVEDWKTVSLEKYQRSDGALFDRRVISAHVAPLLAEIERQKGREMGIKEEVFDIVCKERDTLKVLIDQVRAIAEDRAQGYASRIHGGVLNGQCMDKVCALFQSVPALCKNCAGYGTVSTGIDECPTTICEPCNGTGKASAAKDGE